MVKVKQLTREEMFERIKVGERFIGFVFKNEDCFSGFDFEKHTGIDLKNVVEIEFSYSPNGSVVVPTGVKWKAPIGYELELVPRSGISKNTPIKLSNSPATIEASYRGDVGLLLELNKDKFSFIKEDYKGIQIEYLMKAVLYTVKIPKYTRLVQAKIRKTSIVDGEVLPIYYCIDEKLYKDWEEICPSERGSKGYGSTGVK